MIEWWRHQQINSVNKEIKNLSQIAVNEGELHPTQLRKPLPMFLYFIKFNYRLLWLLKAGGNGSLRKYGSPSIRKPDHITIVTGTSALVGIHLA